MTCDPVSPQTTEIVALSWILELPRDLGLREDSTAALANNQTSLAGWEGRHDEIPEWDGTPADAVPRYRLRFRRARVGIGMPTEATDRAFGELKRLRGLPRLLHSSGLRLLSWRGVKEWKTVCQLTRWYLDAEIPPPPSDPLDPGADSPFHTDFLEMLEHLDVWLQAYGLTSSQVDVGAISLHDLPAMIPWTLAGRRSPDAAMVSATGMLPIHHKVPDVLPAEGDARAAVAATKVMGAGPAAYPFFPPFSLLFQAQAHALAGRSRQAVIDMGTAVEALVAAVITAALGARGRTAEEIDAVLAERWRDVYNRELLKILDVPVGGGPRQHVDWWRHDYDLRVKVVHHGHRPSHSEATKAVTDSWDLADWIGERLRAQPDLVEVAEAIRVERSAQN
jgi:hypothetical protein